MKKIGLLIAGVLTSAFIFFGLVLVLFSSMLSIGSQEELPDISGNGTPPVTGQALEVATKTYQHLMKEHKFTSAGASGALAVGQRESMFDPQAINPAGGVAGLFQWSGWGSFINGDRIHSEGSIQGMDLSTLTLDNEFKLMFGSVGLLQKMWQ